MPIHLRVLHEETPAKSNFAEVHTTTNTTAPTNGSSVDFESILLEPLYEGERFYCWFLFICKIPRDNSLLYPVKYNSLKQLMHFPFSSSASEKRF